MPSFFSIAELEPPSEVAPYPMTVRGVVVLDGGYSLLEFSEIGVAIVEDASFITATS